MEITFKFAIGQLVTTKDSKAAYDLVEGRRSEIQRQTDNILGKFQECIPMTIIERSVHECSGGIQIHYWCAYAAARGYVRSSFNEIELIEHPSLKL